VKKSAEKSCDPGLGVYSLLMTITELIKSGDLKITSPADFKATTVTVEPVTEKGEQEFAKMFSPFAVSAEIRKSAAITTER